MKLIPIQTLITQLNDMLLLNKPKEMEVQETRQSWVTGHLSFQCNK